MSGLKLPMLGGGEVMGNLMQNAETQTVSAGFALDFINHVSNLLDV